MKKLFYIVLFTLTLNCLAQKTFTHVALINATAHIGNGKIIENSLVVFNKRFENSLCTVCNIL